MYPIQDMPANHSWFPDLSIKMPVISVPNLATVIKITPCALALFAAMETPKAEAGPLTEIVCYGACTAAIAANPALIGWYSTCMEACSILGFAPTP